MVRVITQDTFDAVVKENIEDLEMGRKEAVEDAREQFVAQVRQRKSEPITCPSAPQIGISSEPSLSSLGC